MGSIKRTKRSTASRTARRSVKQRPSRSTVGNLRTARDSTTSNIQRPDTDIVDALQHVLRFAMKAAKFNAARVARECGISRATVSKWLSDDHAILVHRIMRSRKLWPHFLLHLFHRETAGGHVG